jgi:signal transduction histidine kinase
VANNPHRYIYFLIAMILTGVLLLALFWEFFLEDRIVPYIYEDYHTKPMYERVEYVVSVLALVIISLVIPTRLALNGVREADQARNALSFAYEDLEGRVQDRTHELIDTNEQLKRALAEQQRYDDALRKSEREYRLLSSQLLTALENERRRIAIDLHDNVTQALVALKYRIEQTLGKVDASTVQVAEIRNILVPFVQESIGEVRDMYMRLRPSMLDDLGLSAALTWLWRDFENAHPEVRIQSQIDVADSDIQDTLKVVIYRVVQEALNNVARHSKADHVHVTLIKEHDIIKLTVQDNGIGFHLEDVLSVNDSLRGMGLSGMRERVHLAGGTLRIESEEESGTQIFASWPARHDSA